jgi:hypothetical protein
MFIINSQVVREVDGSYATALTVGGLPDHMTSASLLTLLLAAALSAEGTAAEPVITPKANQSKSEAKRIAAQTAPQAPASSPAPAAAPAAVQSPAPAAAPPPAPMTAAQAQAVTSVAPAAQAPAVAAVTPATGTPGELEADSPAELAAYANSPTYKEVVRLMLAKPRAVELATAWSDDTQEPEERAALAARLLAGVVERVLYLGARIPVAAKIETNLLIDRTKRAINVQTNPGVVFS